MNNSDVKSVAHALLAAETEDAVIHILSEHGFWDDPGCWRQYGDRAGNFATIGNQQSRPEAALVEKIINSVDARLTNEALTRGIDPTSDLAPATIRAAVARFVEEREHVGDTGGLLQDWPNSRLVEQSHFITIAVTGETPRSGNASITIADCGEGQTPDMMPTTFLSIDRDNKLRIPFVQGKFNMGGTGALKFCGKRSLQLIISRRNPSLLTENDPGRAHEWGFTVVRREHPKPGAGNVRNSVYKYLAPVGATAAPEHGEILSFSSSTFRAMPENNKPYEREMEWGSVIKLYEYDMKGFRSHALMKGGLLSRLELLMPGIALPVRIHECRSYRGVEGRSFTNTLVGLNARLAENRADNLETGYPVSIPFSVRGEPMTAQIFAFKDGRADSYRTNEGIVFVMNGQTHGALPKTFFARSTVKMGRLSSSLLVEIDCTEISVVAREDLFMNSRDRLSNGALRKAIESELEDLIGRHPGLRELRERRRAEEIDERLQDSRPLEDVLQSIMKSSPTLERLFLMGNRISRPHRSSGDGPSHDGGDGSDTGGGDFIGRKHPTFFRFHKQKAGTILSRSCELGRRCRIKFETDVANDYFSRPSTPGFYHAEVVDGSVDEGAVDHSLTLHNGIASWSISLADEYLEVGSVLTLQCSVTDDTLIEPFVNVARITVVPKTNPPSSNGNRPRRGGGNDSSRRGRDNPAGIALPAVVRVHKDDDNWKRHDFDERTACKVIEDGDGGDEENPLYTFYVNVDNLFLRTELKDTGKDVSLYEAKFVYGNVLIGMALLHDARTTVMAPEAADADTEMPRADRIELTTRAMAPFLIPMIDYLGALTEDDAVGIASAGDEE